MHIYSLYNDNFPGLLLPLRKSGDWGLYQDELMFVRTPIQEFSV
jgi:hypothetical protein